jgi:peptidoglycan/LPS O-acetylase OafA/YrhL
MPALQQGACRIGVQLKYNRFFWPAGCTSKDFLMRTIGQIMDENDGIGPGYDTLRLCLAFAVIFRHCFPITYGNSEAASSGPLWTATMAIVPIFFALSGFLVTGSALRLTLGKFVFSRVLRIVPALVVDTLVTILLIGALFTTLPIQQFASDSTTHAYLWNIAGFIHYFLPGVFESNPLPGVVNGALWTIAPELGCYIFISGLIYFGWVRNWKIVLFIAVASIVAIIGANTFPGYLPDFLQKLAAHPGAVLIPNFLIGATMFLKRHAIPYSRILFAACIGIIVLSGFLLPESTFSVMPAWSALTIPIYAYVTVFLGATKLPHIPFFNRGDYSYGIYLYGFPIQQAIVAATAVRNPFLLFALTIPPVVMLAVFSWHLVEKPTLKFRKAFSMAAKREAKRENAEVSSETEQQQPKPAVVESASR